MLDAWNQFIVGTDEEMVMVNLEVYCILIIFCSCISGRVGNDFFGSSLKVKVGQFEIYLPLN